MELVKSNQSLRIFKIILIVLFGSILLTISAKTKIPFYPVPMTMQTFVVLLLGLSFGYKIGKIMPKEYGLMLSTIKGIKEMPTFKRDEIARYLSK